MVSRLEIGLRQDLMDAEGLNIKRKAKDYFGFEVKDIRAIRILTIALLVAVVVLAVITDLRAGDGRVTIVAVVLRLQAGARGKVTVVVRIRAGALGIIAVH